MKRPQIIFTLVYIGVLVQSIQFEIFTSDIEKVSGGDLRLRERFCEVKAKEIQKIFVSCMLFFTFLFDLVIEINRVDLKVLEIDNKIKDLVSWFKNKENHDQQAHNWAPEELHNHTKEYSFYTDDCFSYAMRNGPNQFIQVPNNTLVEGDIIKMLPGQIAPTMIELQPFDFVES